MPFALNSNPNLNEISDAINYLLSNFGSNVSIDIATGIIAGPSGRISNLYKYIQIKYATSYDGSVGFSNVPTGATYYGIRNNNDPTESTDPNEYIWYKTTGFGTTNYLWYIVAGGRQIDFYVSPTAPSDYYVKDPGTAIDIDIVTTTKTVNVSDPAIFIWTSGSAPTRPTTTTTYTWATASYTAPSGWTTSPSTNSTPGYVQWMIRIPLVANSNVTTTVLDWTDVTYSIVQFSANGATGTSGGSGLSALTAYKVQLQTTATPTFSTPTSGSAVPTGWYSTVSAALSAVGLSSFTPGYVVWYIFGQYNSTGSTISGVPANSTAWTGPTAASVFQDIKSDNWNGTTPPTFGTPSTYGTVGYYIQQSTGNMYLNSVYGRGIAQFDGTNNVGGGNYAALVANLSHNQAYGVWAESSSNNGAGIYGYNSNTTNISAYGIFGQNANPYSPAIYGNNYGGGVGIQGDSTGSGIGVYGNSNSGRGVEGTSVSGPGVYGMSISGNGVYSIGPFGTNNNTLVSNLYSDFARSVVGTGGSNQLRFVGGTSTGSATGTFSANKPGSNSTNTWMTIQIDATTLYIPVWT